MRQTELIFTWFAYDPLYLTNHNNPNNIINRMGYMDKHKERLEPWKPECYVNTTQMIRIAVPICSMRCSFKEAKAAAMTCEAIYTMIESAK